MEEYIVLEKIGIDNHVFNNTSGNDFSLHYSGIGDLLIGKSNTSNLIQIGEGSIQIHTNLQTSNILPYNNGNIGNSNERFTNLFMKSNICIDDITLSHTSQGDTKYLNISSNLHVSGSQVTIGGSTILYNDDIHALQIDEYCIGNAKIRTEDNVIKINNIGGDEKLILDTSLIPNLDTSRIATGLFSADRLEEGTITSNLFKAYTGNSNVVLSHAPRFTGTIIFDSSTISSDDRLKTDEYYIANATETLGKIKPQNYYKYANLNHALPKIFESGLIAQEIYYDAPELRHLISLPNDANVEKFIDTSSNPNIDPDYSSWGSSYASVNYIGFIPYLIKSIQELKSEIEALKITISKK